MPDRPRVSPAAEGSPSPTVVSATLAELRETLEKERAARRATEAALRAVEARAARLEAENAQSAEQIGRLEHLVEEFRKALFGRKSERLGADERQLSFDDLGTAIAEAGGQAEPSERAPDEEAGVRQRRRRRGPGSEVRFPAHLERITEVIEPDTIMCPCGCGAMTKIGEDRSERLDVVPAQFRVIEVVRPRYACNRCKEGGVVQAPAPGLRRDRQDETPASIRVRRGLPAWNGGRA